MHQIAVLDDYQNVSQQFGDWAGLRAVAQVTVFNDHLTNEEALVERLQPFDVLCVMRERTPLPRSLLQRLPRLRLIATTGNWNAAIDIDAAEELGITVCGTASSLTAAAELTWALVLASVRRLPQELASLRQGGWQVSVGGDLHGRTLGLLGLGYTGAMVARYGQAFGMRVLAWSQNMTPEAAAQHGALYVSKDELFAQSDIVSIHVRLSPRTRGLVGARELALMQPSTFLINTARGPIVDEAALLEVLQQRRIAGAAVDVFAQEPLPPQHPFRSLDNLIATAHIGYVTQGSYELYYGESVQNIRAWIAGRPIRTMSTARREVDYVSRPVPEERTESQSKT
jgi:phosphoglycerate dehydrogenase-like enzyme